MFVAYFVDEILLRLPKVARLALLHTLHSAIYMFAGGGGGALFTPRYCDKSIVCKVTLPDNIQ